MIRTALVTERNNLDKSSSPYLLQHVDNPVWWQEWSNEIIRHAAATNKPLFVSVGYSTCHWCHVMASEAFSDQETAAFLNENFICVKIDREQRPDIDQFMMDFINRLNGRGGWPLNVFLTPGIHPFFALTYAPVNTTETMYSFLSIAKKVLQVYRDNKEAIPAFTHSDNESRTVGENSLIRILSDYYDPYNGGFGSSHKFPPHSTLLFLLYQLSLEMSPSIQTICTKTLDSMLYRGLNDHLQGGIFRYCVDNEWTIPHFEKMLYDQAMALWTYSIAYKLTGKSDYRRMSQRILKCLSESFEMKGFYISAHDADTDHKEGLTYLWTYDQLKENLDDAEFSKFASVYFITPHGNFEGKNHLVRRNTAEVNADEIESIENKLLSIRRKRKQPGRDDKVLSGNNALTAISLIQAGRYLDDPSLETKAAALVRSIINTFWNGKRLAHSLFNGILQENSFLYDAAALYTAVSFLYESDSSWSEMIDTLHDYVLSFREDSKWVESRTSDFVPVYAAWFDHPIPSGISLAEMGLARVSFLKGRDQERKEFREPFQSDFYNISVMMNNGLFHFFTSIRPLPWVSLPVNSIQKRGIQEQDCYMGTCSPLI